MHYLTQYYKNLSEQLQQRLNHLENLLEEEKKVYRDLPPPSVPVAPGSIQEPGPLEFSSWRQMTPRPPFTEPRDLGKQIDPMLDRDIYKMADTLFGDPTLPSNLRADIRPLVRIDGKDSQAQVNASKENVAYLQSPEWIEATSMPMTLPDGSPNMERVEKMKAIRAKAEEKTARHGDRAEEIKQWLTDLIQQRYGNK